MPLFSVRADLLPMKAHFFLFNAGTAPVVPFMPVYAKQLGFSSVLVGTIYMILPLMGMLAKPLMGALADRFRCHKLLFVGSIVLSMVSFFLIMYVPAVEGKLVGEIHCGVDTNVRICPPPNKNDKCMVEKILAERKDNTSIICTMECVGYSKFITEVCKNWGIAQYCSTTSREPSNHLIQVAKLHAVKANLELAGKTMFVKSTSAPPTSEPQDMKFRGSLQPYHTLEEGGCIFIRLTGVIDSTQPNDSRWHIPYCNSTASAQCKFECDSPALVDIGEDRDLQVPVVHYQFWAFVVLLITSWVGMAVVVSVGDTICFGLLGDRPSDYGYQRLWGSIGWGLFSIIAGLLVDYFSSGLVRKEYTPVFYMMAVLLSLDVAVSTHIKDTERKQSLNILRDVGKMLMNIRIVVFMLWCIVVGMCTAMIWNFLFWHLEDLAKGCTGLEWIKTLEGLIMCIQCFGGELPFFFISGWLIKKIGHVNAMSLVLFAFGIRFLLYSLLVDPWWCLPIELLNGLTFGVFYATMASYASIIAPPGTEATIQGLVGAVFEGVGVSLGSFIGGLLMYYMNGASVFRLYGLIVLSICCLHVCLQFYLARHCAGDVGASGKDYNHCARYASPNDAMSMLGDQYELTNS